MGGTMLYRPNSIQFEEISRRGGGFPRAGAMGGGGGGGRSVQGALAEAADCPYNIHFS